MFGKPDIIKAIKKGDLEEVKKILQDEPYLVEKTFKFYCPYTGNLLQTAAFFNKPEIVKFLAKNIGVNLHGDYSALHFAAMEKAGGAIKTLLDLGANPCLRDGYRKFPYEECRDQELKKLLYAAYLEWQNKKAPVKPQTEEALPQKILKQPAEEQKVQVPDRIKGIWTKSEVPDEVIFERDMPEQKLRLTETFNFEAELRILIAANLETGNLSQPETKIFSEIPKRAEQARAALAKLGDNASARPASIKNYPKLTLNNPRS